jgi:hypothetical protein
MNASRGFAAIGRRASATGRRRHHAAARTRAPVALLPWSTELLVPIAFREAVGNTAGIKTQPESRIKSFLHLGCARQFQTVDFPMLTAYKSSARTPAAGHSTRRSLGSNLDPLVAEALFQAGVDGPSHLDAHSHEDKQESASSSSSVRAPDDPSRWQCLVVGVDVVPPPSTYPGLSMIADVHYAAHTRGVLQNVMTARTHAPHATGAPLFDVLVSDTLLAPVPSDDMGARRSSLSLNNGNGAALPPVAIVSSLTSAQDVFDTIAFKGPTRSEAEHSFIADPVMASIAVGLPLLCPTDGIAVIRLSDQCPDRSRVGAVMRTLQQRFANVNLYRDEIGMIALAFGPGARAEHVLSSPQNLREDFPGFMRDEQKRPRQWNHHRNHLDTRGKFFMALHPAFDKAPPADVLAAQLHKSKAEAEAAEIREEAFMGMVSQALDEFEDVNRS